MGEPIPSPPSFTANRQLGGEATSCHYTTCAFTAKPPIIFTPALGALMLSWCASEQHDEQLQLLAVPALRHAFMLRIVSDTHWPHCAVTGEARTPSLTPLLYQRPSRLRQSKFGTPREVGYTPCRWV